MDKSPVSLSQLNRFPGAICKDSSGPGGDLSYAET